ncbi:MAG: hypothetical protein ACE5KF_00400 [Kiloniellaceae bacterium]
MKREPRRRSKIEAAIGQLKTDGRLDRNDLRGHAGDRGNAILVGAGYNYRLVPERLRILFARIMAAIRNAMRAPLTAPVAPSA